MPQFMKTHKRAVIVTAVIILALSVAFFFSGSPALKNSDTEISASSVSLQDSSARQDGQNSSASDFEVHSVPSDTSVQSFAQDSAPSSSQDHTQYSAQDGTESVSETDDTTVDSEASAGDDMNHVPSDTASSEQQSDAPVSGYESPVTSDGQSDNEKPQESDSCAFSISCGVLNAHLSELKQNKRSLVPKDGMILKDTNVTLTEGESVFDITKRLCRDNSIHFEFTLTPIYNTAYVEGINNLYEFDCGSGSGWMYSVNGEFPSCGCSDYYPKKGDVIRWHYTVNMGKDLG